MKLLSFSLHVSKPDLQGIIKKVGSEAQVLWLVCFNYCTLLLAPLMLQVFSQVVSRRGSLANKIYIPAQGLYPEKSLRKKNIVEQILGKENLYLR